VLRSDSLPSSSTLFHLNCARMMNMIVHRLRSIILASFLGSILVVATVLIGACGYTPEELSRMNSSSERDNNTPEFLDNSELAARIHEFSRTKFPAHYSGVAISGNDSIKLFRKPGSNLDAAVASQFTEIDVEFIDSAYSLQSMEDITEKVMKDSSYWQDRDVSILGVGPAPDGSGVEVNVQNPSEVEQAFIKHYGPIVKLVDRGPAMFAK